MNKPGSIVGDLILGYSKVDRKAWHSVSVDSGRPSIRIAQSGVVILGVFVSVLWIVLNYSGLIVDPLNFFFVAYSVQFALVGCIVFGAARLGTNPHAGVVSVSIGVFFSLVLGVFGLWSLSRGVEPFEILSTEQVVSLCPVFAIVSSLVSYACCRVFLRSVEGSK